MGSCITASVLMDGAGVNQYGLKEIVVEIQMRDDSSKRGSIKHVMTEYGYLTVQFMTAKAYVLNW